MINTKPKSTITDQAAIGANSSDISIDQKKFGRLGSFTTPKGVIKKPSMTPVCNEPLY
ncbi:hypothetical protein EV13_0965 [Prochlorococcus sp. MIT 0702]|nr:hypothetical protein EV13_0965 [Prochlorococcus sp. MIT 0702]KGG34303.1 hypothetical protein EV14_1397 [Prochlorococcus sp. MIT 0703]